MGLFCKGFGFGEIEKAFSLSAATGAPIEQILGWRSSGLGWGEIEKILKESTTTTPMMKPKSNQGQGNSGGQGGPPGRGPKPKKNK